MWAQKNKWKTSLQNYFHGNPLSILSSVNVLNCTEYISLNNNTYICRDNLRKKKKEINNERILINRYE
jgi:hypothetical protein